MKINLTIFLLLFCCLNFYSQDKKTLNIVKASVAPKIDAVLNDAAWQDAEIATDFIQFRPEMGCYIKTTSKNLGQNDL